MDAVGKGIFPTVLSVMKMDTHWQEYKATDRHKLNPTSESVYSKNIPALHTPGSLSPADVQQTKGVFSASSATEQ